MTDDEAAIRKLIARQFGSLNWLPGTSGDWAGFTADFLPGAPLYAAARPVKAQTAEAFVKRMKGLAGSDSVPSPKRFSELRLECSAMSPLRSSAAKSRRTMPT
jgi:hypothetical protein